MSHTDVLFRDLHADDLPEVMEVESFCVNCYENGITKLLLTKLPFYREVIVSSFNCEHCGFQNNSTDCAGKCQDKGVKFTLRVLNENDLKRRIVLSNYSMLKIPELDSEFPITTGRLTTIEGVLMTLVENIKELQDERRKVIPEVAVQLDQFIEKMEDLISLKKDFLLELSDPSGNCVIENFLAPSPDPELTIKYYKRSKEENERLCINDIEEDGQDNIKTYADEAQNEFKPMNEVVFFNDNCSNCNAPIECRMKILDIPNFKEVIVMASSCDSCGNRENQITGGCGIAEKGQRITLKINEPDDLSRDFLVSESACINIPELDIEKGSGNRGGRFTTVQGLLENIADQLAESNPFLSGDSATETQSEATLIELITKVRKIASGDLFGMTLIVSDPAGNSYIQDLYTPAIDPRLVLESYDRTDEENEDLGLNDMKTKEFET